MLLCIGFVLFPINPVDAKRLEPIEQLFHVLPSAVSGSGWQHISRITEQSVTESALLQEFSTTNSASFGVAVRTSTQNAMPVPTPASELNVSDAVESGDQNTLDEVDSSSTQQAQDVSDVLLQSDVTEVQSQQIEAPQNTPDRSSSEPEPAPESADSFSEPAVAEPESEGVLLNFFKRATERFLFTQADMTEAVVPAEPDEIVTTQSDELASPAPTEESESITEPDAPVLIDDVLVGEDVSTPADSAPPALETGASSPDTSIVSGDASDSSSSATQDDTVPVIIPTINAIELSGFGLPDLEPGQFIETVQLRVSMAADMHSVSEGEALPSIRAQYSFGSFTGTAGSILLDTESSNAMNGGYYLLALPSIADPALLNELTITLSYEGDAELVRALFIDAAWLEISTKSFTKELIENRKDKLQFDHLAPPSLSELISPKVNFGRFDDLVFNFKYTSQRNFVVRTARQLFGRDLAAIESVSFVHRDLGDVGVVPEVRVTADGLVSVQIPDADKARLRPGQYTIELEINEGGRVFMDSFDFQWGMLSLNPRQSEYQIGEEVNIALGSLSPNGNTVCNAELDLYIVAPDDSVTKTPVISSGLCNGNNVIDTPDYEAKYTTVMAGTYEMYLERLDENGEVISYTSDTFEVVAEQPLVIERSGPTRIYPVAPYTMEMTVRTRNQAFTGELIERVPNSFEITDTNAQVVVGDEWQELIWPVSLGASSSEAFYYEFDAPNISPYLFTLGPARLQTTVRREPSPAAASDVVVDESVAPDIATSSDETVELPAASPGLEEVDSAPEPELPPAVSTPTEPAADAAEAPLSQADVRPFANATINDDVLFVEHRQWQIASDAVGNMVLYWADGAAIPTDWTCLSCGSGTFFERFARGGATYNTTGGALTHTHTAIASVAQTLGGGVIENQGGTVISVNDHTHTVTPTIGTASNLPLYRTLRVIQYTGGAGEPPTLPAGAIALFDAAVPSGWTRYAAQDGYYIYGANTVGTTGGSNTHTHTLSGTLSTPGGGTLGRRGGGSQQPAAGVNHTHSFSTPSQSASNEPPYIEVILGQIDATGALPIGMITMWTEDVPAGWIDVSTDGAAPFNGRFVKAAASYGATGGSETHTQPDSIGITAAIATADTQSGRAGTLGSSNTHNHLVDVTNFSDVSHLPPYLTVVYGKRIGLDTVFTQANYRWYTNRDNQTPDDPWSSGVAIDVPENTPISATTTPVSDGEVVRLRINALIGNATSTIGAETKLQYAAAPICESAGGWTDVGAAGSGAIWRGFNNATPADNATLSTTVLASSTHGFTYQENGIATGTPVEVLVDGYGEWDFVLQHNGAAAGTQYCFRLVYGDDSLFFGYDTYPQLITNGPPETYQQIKRFDNENTASTLPTFDFLAIDPEGDDVDYQIQIASDPAFSSVVVDRNSVAHATQFENQVLTSEKNPFTSGQTIRFTNSTTLSNGSTYWWRIRGRDTDASGVWGDWSSGNSFTVSTSLIAAGWLQRQDEQFERGTLTNTEVFGSDAVRLVTGQTTGTVVSPTIDFNQGDSGTAWGSLRFVDDTTNGAITYRLEYRNPENEWNLIPDGDLPSNSTGFSTSPVSLLSLDVNTYRFIRVVATLTDSGGTPLLEEWAVDWGFRVETPVVESPFPNEKVSTTTPTFIFTTSDPQNDGLTYQIAWSTDATFAAGVTTRTSDTDSGFVNLDNGADTDPFVSGDDILFTVAGADALTDGTTYWWRVRAKDTTGDNEYSFWTTPQSLTVDTAVQTSTWFQTTAEQFESNILSGTTGVSGGVTVSAIAEEAMIVYGEGTATTPKYRLWNGTAWSAEDELLDINSTVRSVVTQAGVTREEYIAGTIGTNGHVIAQVFALGEWGSQQTMTTTIGSTATRGFDIAYETISGDAMIVYCDGDANPSYRIWNGSAWSAETTITSSLTSACRWVELASDPTTDEMVLVLRGVDAAPYEALVWNGSSWGNSTTLGTARVATYSGIGVTYEESGDQAVVVAPSAGGGPNRMVYRTWNGTTWSAETTQTIGGRLYWADIASNVGTDELMMCYINDASEVRAIRWTGTAWANDTLFTATVNSSADPAFSCVFENGGARENYVVGAYSDTTQTNYRNWNTTTWSTPTQVNSIVQSATMQLVRTGNDAILGTFFDYNNTALRFGTWNGTAWSATQTLEDDTSVTTSPYGTPYFMAPRNPGSEGTVVVSPPIEFTDGLGPYWDEFSWNDTQLGTSDIVYQLQYFNGTTWQFIPNAALPGNETGFATGPIDLSALPIATYGTIRPYATLSCDGASNCPTLLDWTVTWAEGITVSGTIEDYTQTANVNSGTVAIAVNGVLQIGKTGTVSAGAWSIDNVTTFAGDIVTVFLTGAADANEAVGVARYSGAGDITGVELFERHLSIGSNSATTTPITNANIGLYDFTNTEDIFANVTGTTLSACADAGCDDVRLYVKAGAVYQPSGRVVTHDVDNRGTFTAGSFTHDVSGSWNNTGTTTMTGSTVVLTAQAGTETINTTGAVTRAFNNLTFGTTTGTATWTLQNELVVNGTLLVERGTVNRGTQSISVQGALHTNANGFWSGLGTTTFNGTGAATWRDQNAVLQNVGYVVVDGTPKTVTLTGPAAAQSIAIGADDALDVSNSNHALTVFGSWSNNNTFLARQGTVNFVGTTTGLTITPGSSAFYNLSYGGPGSWSFTNTNLTVLNNFTIASGTVTFPTGITSVGGSFDATGGTFAHNNGEVRFTANTARTITVAGGAFTNTFYDLRFAGAGSWTMTDSATTSRNVIIASGVVTFPATALAIGGSLTTTAGTFSAPLGTVNFYGAATETIATNASTFANVSFTGPGTWSFTEANVALSGTMTVATGAVTLPATQLSLGGSYSNAATVNAGTSTVRFVATTLGNTIDLGGSALHGITFDNATGGWTVVANATATGPVALLSAGDWTLQSGATLSVGGAFSNNVGGASTTWSGSTLSLESGAYAINTKTDAGDAYDTLRIVGADVAMWNSVATTYDVAVGSLYSQDHNAVDGDLYIFGTYERVGGNEYWSYETDFDGADLTGGAERSVQVRLANGASAAVSDGTFAIVGDTLATTTVRNQGSGTYTLSVSAGTTTVQYFDIDHLGGTGFSLLEGTVVELFDDGQFTVSGDGGSAITLASSTIDSNPAKQLFRVGFATTTAIAATNVTQVGGTPASYWWFRNGFGNLYGEAYDNDTGDPGSVRFDDSSLSLTISGTVYSDDGVTPLIGGTCDGSTGVVRVVVNGGTSYTTSCSAVDGTYSVSGVVVVGDPVLSVYLDGASGGERAVMVTRTPTGDITDADLYANRVIVRNEDVAPLTIAQLAVYDATDDADMLFVAATGTTPLLTTPAGTELYVWSNAEFAPGGGVVLGADSQLNGYDGSLVLAASSTFQASATTSVVVGGRFVQAAGATFIPASSTVIMNATTTGKSVSGSGTINFYNLSFTGVGGAWNIGTDIVVGGDLLVDAGTVTGTEDVLVTGGDFTGDGIVSFGGGTTTLLASPTLGGATAWTFNNLALGDGLVVGTTTSLFTSTTTILSTLSIANAHFLPAGSSVWDLAGSGTVLVVTGTFVPNTSTVRYSGNGASVASLNYYNLDINAGAGTPTYSATGLGIVVENDLSVGGESTSTFDLNTADTALAVGGSVRIRSNGVITASDSGVFTVGGDWQSTGGFTGNGGTVTFDGAGLMSIDPGAAVFSSVVIDAPGSVEVVANATATAAWTLVNHSQFTVTSGTVLAVGGTFSNQLGGAATTWTGSTLALFGGGNYSINASTTRDSYATLAVRDTTQIRMWNSEAATYAITPTASLYSQNHADVSGDLYVYGAYLNNARTDHWSYARDFDGTTLTGGAERAVTVRVADGASVTLASGGTLNVIGTPTATTSIANQGSGSYALSIAGGTTNWSYYQLRDMNSAGLAFTGSPTVTSLSHGDIEVDQTAGTGMTVAGSVITANPAKTFTNNRFALGAAASGFNVTVTGSTVSSWRFTNHIGALSGEAFDVDPDGDPGYAVWDDSAALITISGRVFSSEGSGVSSVCDGSTNVVTVRVAGLTSYQSSCNAATGVYSVTDVAYSPGDSFVAYIDNQTPKAATVSAAPISNISNFDLYHNRVIVRHEDIDPLTIADMSVWDSSDDADIPFTAITGSPDVLTLPANRKLIVWDDKTFAPDGTVTVAGGGTGDAVDGTVELYAGASYVAGAGFTHTIGGSLITAPDATFDGGTADFVFTSSASGREVGTAGADFFDVTFTGTGGWTLVDSTFGVHDISQTAGALTLPTGTTTVSGSMTFSGGTADANTGRVVFTSVDAGEVVLLSGSSLHEVEFTGSGSWSMSDVNATTTASFIVETGTVTLPSGQLSVGADFRNAGIIVANAGELVLTSTTTANVLTSGSDLEDITFAGGGSYTFLDTHATLLGSFTVTAGEVALPEGLATSTLSVGGSFLAAGGTFTAASTTVLLNGTSGSHTINPGMSVFSNLQIGAPSASYTVTASATTTGNLSLNAASGFVVDSGVTVEVGGVFTNYVGGAATTWTGSTLVLGGQNAYTVNTKAVPGDSYATIVVGADSDIRIWNSSAVTTTVAPSASLYSQDHAAINGDLNIYGDFIIATTSEYWSYDRDFDGTSLLGSERVVTVRHAENASTTLVSGALSVVGSAGNQTLVTNQGSGTYAWTVTGGTFTAEQYTVRNANAAGLAISGTPTINSLSSGDFEVVIDTGTAITLAASALNANASFISTNNRFATTSAISATNVNLIGTTPSAWTFVGHTGNLAGEAYDIDGVTECGSVRWDDSACLLIQQTQYRWRNDDGGVGVPASEWFDTDWNARQQVRIVHSEPTGYTNPVIKLTVPHDALMRSDFADLRFTAADGVTLIDHFIETYTANTEAIVWVQVATLPANQTTRVFMYFDNAVATDSSAAADVFTFAETFEGGSLPAAYSGDTSLFNVGTTFNYERTYGLDNTGNRNARATDGIFRTDVSIAQGQTLRYFQYVDTADGSGDEVCTLFAVQTPGTANDNYGVCLEQFGVDRISLVRDVIDTDASGVILASSTVSYTTGWYEVEVDWRIDDEIVVRLYRDGTLVTTIQASDSTYTSGGVGFTYWFNYGGWDLYTARPYMATTPTVYFGATQGDGGASWAAAQNAPANGINPGDTARIRFAVENSGLTVTDQEFRLEYAARGAAPSCEAVAPAEYVAVPPQASCGSSPLCMQTSTQVTNGESTTDLLTGVRGQFILGEVRTSPSNTTAPLDVAQNEYTELEYAITPTNNVVDQNLCLRVTDAGSELDTYLRVAALQLRFDPVVENVSLNANAPIQLTAGTTTRVYATGTVEDFNGYTDIVAATSTIYRSGAGAACTPDNNNCYISSTEAGTCSFTGCSDNSCEVMCYADIFFHADPTDVGVYEGQEWLTFIEVEDLAGGYDFESALSGVELLLLRAVAVDGVINYGALEVNNDTGAFNPSIDIANIGNVEFDIEVIGTDLTNGAASVIPAAQQKIATSTFTYNACVTCASVSTSTAVDVALGLEKPTTDSPPVTSPVYWGISVPFGVASSPHQGFTTITPVSID